MSSISFTEIEENKPSSTAVAVVPATEKAIITSQVPLADASKGLIGEWTQEDTKLPRISLVNKSGDLANLFTPGIWVLEKSHALSKLVDKTNGGPIKVTALRMLKQYKENITFEDQNSGVPVNIFNGASEVSTNGGRVSRERGAGNYSEIAHIELLVLAPEDLDEEAAALFYNEAGDKRYARVIYTTSSTAYGQVAVPLASSLRGHLASSGLQGGVWDLGSKLTSNTKNSWWSPTIKAAGLVDAETAKLIASLI